MHKYVPRQVWAAPHVLSPLSISSFSCLYIHTSLMYVQCACLCTCVRACMHVYLRMHACVCVCVCLIWVMWLTNSETICWYTSVCTSILQNRTFPPSPASSCIAISERHTSSHTAQHHGGHTCLLYISLPQTRRTGIYGHICELSFDAGHHSSEGKGYRRKRSSNLCTLLRGVSATQTIDHSLTTG